MSTELHVSSFGWSLVESSNTRQAVAGIHCFERSSRNRRPRSGPAVT